MHSRIYLVLENGSIYEGKGFGAQAPLASELVAGREVFSGAGELVFNTAMLGYCEVLTDPSYTGQIIAMTYPHMGNYGCLDQWNESGPVKKADGGPAATSCDLRPVKASAFVIRSLYRGPVPTGRITLDGYLKRHGIPGISEVDTRRLTLELRDFGSRNAVLAGAANPSAGFEPQELEAVLAYLKAFPKMEGRNLVTGVGSTEVFSIPGDPGAIYAGKTLALLDCGTKANIIRELARLGCTVKIFPSASGAGEILASRPHALMISNGPGDPEVLANQIAVVREIIGKIPVFGICLGHQLISEAMGAKTFKMKFGHHGISHPVRDERSKKVFVTSQNHGFAVDEASLPDSAEVWFRNANDQTIEGIRDDSLPVLSTQFHPESSPGPHDSHWIFEEFLSTLK